VTPEHTTLHRGGGSLGNSLANCGADEHEDDERPGVCVCARARACLRACVSNCGADEHEDDERPGVCVCVCVCACVCVFVCVLCVGVGVSVGVGVNSLIINYSTLNPK
jgi:hypothetical protein